MNNNIGGIRNGIYIKNSSKYGGLGVFTSEDIQENDIIEISPYFKISYNYNVPVLNDYGYNYDDNFYSIILGYGSIYNHSDEPNIKWELYDEKEIYYVFKAIKNIPKDSELCSRYGDGYWKSREHKKKKL